MSDAPSMYQITVPTTETTRMWTEGTCSYCGDTFRLAEGHSCVPAMLTRIAALEADVAYLKSILGYSNVKITFRDATDAR